MWFKNVIAYKLHDTATIAGEALEQALRAQAYRPLGGSEARRIGWTAPAGRESDILHHELQGNRLMTAMRQERILPPSVVREEADECVSDIEAQECRKLRRQENQTITHGGGAVSQPRGPEHQG